MHKVNPETDKGKKNSFSDSSAPTKKTNKKLATPRKIANVPLMPESIIKTSTTAQEEYLKDVSGRIFSQLFKEIGPVLCEAREELELAANGGSSPERIGKLTDRLVEIYLDFRATIDIERTSIKAKHLLSSANIEDFKMDLRNNKDIAQSLDENSVRLINELGRESKLDLELGGNPYIIEKTIVGALSIYTPSLYNENKSNYAMFESFVHYANNSLNSIPVGLDGLEKEMREKSNNALIICERMKGKISQAHELFSLLGRLGNISEHAFLLFKELPTSNKESVLAFISALHEQIGNGFDGTLNLGVPAGQPSQNKEVVLKGKEARDYLARALKSVMHVNSGTHDEKMAVLGLLGRLESGEDVGKELLAANQEFNRRLGELCARAAMETPELVGPSRTLGSHIANAMNKIMTLADLDVPDLYKKKKGDIIGEMTGYARVYFALLDRLNPDSLYEMKILLENKYMDDAAIKLR